MGNHARYLTGALGKQTRPKVIELQHLTIIQGQQALLCDNTLDIFEGEIVAFVGSSEHEKKILLAGLLGHIPPTSGEIRVLGNTLPPLPPELRRQIGVMPQHIDYATGKSVAAYLQRFGAYYGVQLTSAQLAAYCAHYGLIPTTSVVELSRLQIRLLALSLALVHDPRLVLLIEPLANLDEEAQTTIQNYLQRIQREGRTVLCTFTPSLAEKHCTGYDVVVKLEQGRFVRQDS